MVLSHYQPVGEVQVGITYISVIGASQIILEQDVSHILLNNCDP